MQSLPLSRKRGRDSFKQLVKDCRSPSNVLTRVRIVKFTLGARAYICTYYYFEQNKNQQNIAVDAITVIENSTKDTAPSGALEKQLLLDLPEIENKVKNLLQGGAGVSMLTLI